MFSKDKVIDIYFEIDEFCKEFDREINSSTRLPLKSDDKKTRSRACTMSASEILTILSCFHLGAHKTFKHYYFQIVKSQWSDLFPKLLSYNRFIEVESRYFYVFSLFLAKKCLGKCTGISFIDSTTLKICKNQRINRNKVFKGLAKRGKSSMGWFYGFKLHLICNEKGELLSFYLTQGNVDDRNHEHIKTLTKTLFGKLFGDKGYLSKSLWEQLYNRGINLFTRVKKNMKERTMELMDKLLLRKRAVIETINDELKNHCQIEHTRHRSVNNFIKNIIGGLIAYSFFPKKPSININYADLGANNLLA